MSVSGEQKEFIQKIFRLFGAEEDFHNRFVGNGHTGSVWRISDSLCLKVGTDTNYKKLPETFKKCENLCVPLRAFRSQSGKYIGVIQRYLNLDSLQYFIKNDIKLSEEQVTSILCDILKGLKVIHEHGYVHRDFYPGNVMLTETDEKVMAVIIDFDEMQSITPETRACFQYNGYQAPEIVFDNDVYDDKSEMFTVGVILWELTLGKCPFGGYDFFGRVIADSWDNYTQNRAFYNDRVKNALNNLPNYLEKTEELSNECANLLCSLLSFNKEERISAKEALEHPFFQKVLGNECKNNRGMLDMERD